MNTKNDILIIDSYVNGKNLLIYKGWVNYCSQIFNIHDEKKVEAFLEEHRISDRKWHEVIKAIHSNTSHVVKDKSYHADVVCFAFLYCYTIGVDQKMRSIILESESNLYAFRYCLKVSDDDDMRQILLNSKSAEWSYTYCKNISDNDDMRMIMLTSEDDIFINKYNSEVANNNDVLRYNLLPCNI